VTTMNISSVMPQTLIGSSARAAEAASGFGKAPVALVSDIETATARLFAAAASANLGKSNDSGITDSAALVSLRQPDPALARALNNEKAEQGKGADMLAMLMAMLQELLGETSITQLKSRLSAFVQRMNGQKAAGERLSEALKEAQKQAETSVEAATGTAADAEAALAAAEEARQEAARLQAELDAMDPDAEGYEALAGKVKQANEHVTMLTGVADDAVAAAALAATAAADALDAVEKLYAEMDGATAGRLAHLTPPDESRGNGQARLGMLLAMLSEIVANNKELKLKADTEFVIDRLKRIEEANKRYAAEYEAEVEKARQAQETMGCIGKIVGWVITVVAVVAAPFTGGASMALAAVGLALAIVEETTGFSLLGEAFQPLLTEVMPFLVKIFASVATAVLKAVGVDDATAAEIGQWIGTVQAAFAMVAAVILAVVLGKAAAAKLVTQFGKAIGQSVAKAMPEMLKAAGKVAGNASSRLSGAFSKMIGSSTDKLAVRAGQFMMAVQAAQFGNQTAQGVGRVVVADMEMDAAAVLAEFDFSMVMAQQTRQELTNVYDQFARSNEVVQWLNKKMSDVLADQAQAGKFVIGHMRA
jgi:invasin B